MQEKLLFVDLISNHIQVVMTHWMEYLPEYLARVSSYHYSSRQS